MILFKLDQITQTFVPIFISVYCNLCPCLMVEIKRISIFFTDACILINNPLELYAYQYISLHWKKQIFEGTNKMLQY
jgi:hypothetical protein